MSQVRPETMWSTVAAVIRDISAPRARTNVNEAAFLLYMCKQGFQLGANSEGGVLNILPGTVAPLVQCS